MTEKKGPIMYKEVSGWKVAPERQLIYSPKGRASISPFFKVSAILELVIRRFLLSTSKLLPHRIGYETCIANQRATPARKGPNRLDSLTRFIFEY